MLPALAGSRSLVAGVSNQLPLGKTVVAAELRLLLATTLPERRRLQGRHRRWPSVIAERDHRQVGRRGVGDLASAHVLGLDSHTNLHRGAPGCVDRRPDGNELSDVDGVHERHPVHPRRDDAHAAMTYRSDARDLIAHTHDHSAVHVSRCVRVLDSHPARQDGASVGGVAPIHRGGLYATQPAPSICRRRARSFGACVGLVGTRR